MLDASEVAKHNGRESCWVVIENQVYDVTDFLEEHPGGASIILRYGGKDATEEYLPVHPPGTIEKELPRDKHLGPIDLSTVTGPSSASTVSPSQPTLSPSDALPIGLCLNLHDLERAAKAVVSKRAWTYYNSAADDLLAHHTNLTDWSRITFRPRVMRNVQRVDITRTILGQQSSLPIFIAPAALGRLGHPDGELCLARGSARRHVPYIVSTASSVSAEELAQCAREEKGEHLMFQLYVKKKKSESVELIRNAKKLGFKALVVTVDTPVVGKREEDDRHKLEVALAAGDTVDPRVGASTVNDKDYVFRGPFSSTLNWDDLSWIREEWGDAGPICLKGIGTAEDAKMACELGVSHIYLSNHGGRQMDSCNSSLRTLLEIRRFCPEVFDQCEVLVDGGARRGHDVIKALCLGAKAVGFGRPFMYALSAYGTEGVLKAIQMISDELETGMRLLGVTSLDQLRPHMVTTRSLEAEIILDLPEFNARKSKL